MNQSSAAQVHIGVQLVKNENKKGYQPTLYVSGAGKQQGQEVKKPFDKQDFCMQMKEYIDGIFDPTTAMSEQDRQKFEQEIQRKIHSGEKLTADEMQYLRIHDPKLYAMMCRVQTQREALKARLQSCRSKQEAQEVFSTEMARIDEDDPAAEALRAAYMNVWQEFTGSEEYRSLPETKSEADEQQDPNAAEEKKVVFDRQSTNQKEGAAL